MEQDLIFIDKKKISPKYRQIVDSIVTSISKGALKIGDIIPSLNQIKDEFSLSRDTVLTAYKELQTKGIIESLPGKGYYVASTQIKIKYKVFLLFDELNAYKEKLYRSFISQLKEEAIVDIYFHHFNINVFKTLIKENINNYNTFVIMPVFFTGIDSILKNINPGRIYLLDHWCDELNDYPGIFQNFEKDTFNALNGIANKTNKYKNMTLVEPENGLMPKGIMIGFEKSCKKIKMRHRVATISKIKEIKKGDSFLILDDNDLIEMIRKLNTSGLEIGNEVGIISYNDTPFKEVVHKGITTISTDFEGMGKGLANMIRHKENRMVENSFLIHDRQSY